MRPAYFICINRFSDADKFAQNEMKYQSPINGYDQILNEFRDQDKATAKAGSSTLLYCQSDLFGNKARRIILIYDLSAFPSTTDKITKIEFTYYVNTAAGTTRSAHWNRITQSGVTEAGASWNNYSGGHNWINPGGDFTTSKRIGVTYRLNT